MKYSHKTFCQSSVSETPTRRKKRKKTTIKAIAKPFTLKVQSCKSYNNKYMVASTQITNNEIFPFIAALAFKLLNRKVLFVNRKTIETVKTRLLFKKIVNFTGKLLQNYK